MRIAVWIAGVAVIALALIVSIAWGVANTGWGLRWLAAFAPTATGGTVTVSGLSGRFPDALRAAHIELRDKQGSWAEFDDVTLDWRPLQLIHGDAVIDLLAAARGRLWRFPVAEQGSSKSGLPVVVDVARWRVEEMTLDPAVARTAASLKMMGAAHLATNGAIKASVAAQRLDAPGSYRLDAEIDTRQATAHLELSEPDHGLIAHLADLPDIGPIAVTANLDGPRNAERLAATASAGKLKATAQGTIDLVALHVDLDGSIDAPAMRPRPDIGWQSITAALHIHGGVTKPEVDIRVRLDRPAIAGATAQTAELSAQGNRGAVSVTGSIAGVTLPGMAPDLLAGTPVRIDAKAQLDTRAVDFSVTHPLLTVTGRADIASAQAIKGSATWKLPSLTPFAALAGVELRGSGQVETGFARDGDDTKITATGDVDVSGGEPQLTKLIGGKTRLDLTARLSGGDITIERAAIAATSITAAVSGTDRRGTLDLTWQMAVPDVARVAPQLRGQIAAQGRLTGPAKDLSVSAALTGALGTDRVAKEPIQVTLEAHGLPGAPQGKAIAKGRFAGAPLQVAVIGKRDPDGTLRVTIDRASWKGTEAHGALALAPGANWPLGKLDMRIRLADASALAGQPLAGTVEAALILRRQSGRAQLQVSAQGQGIDLPSVKLARAKFDGTIDEPLAAVPTLSWLVALDGITVNGATGDATLSVKGRASALRVTLSSRWRENGSPEEVAQLSAAAVLDMRARKLRLDAVDLSAHGEHARLLAPARIDLSGGGMAVDRLRFGAQRAVLDIAGRILPKLDLTASLRNATPQLAASFLPGLKGGGGTVRLDARLTGTVAAPRGTIRLQGRGLAIHSGAAAPFPAASVDVTVLLNGFGAQLDARVDAGRTVHLTASGQLPLAATAPINLNAEGRIDLAMLDPILAADGRSVHGSLTFDATVRGTPDAPQIGGTAKLAHAEVQDYVQGLHITDIAASFTAANGVIRIVDFTGHSGPGTISLSGTVDLSQRLVPVDLRIDAKHARLLQNDLLTAQMDAALTLKGQVGDRLALAGTIQVSSANINIPEKFPQSVAVLNVTRPGRPQPPPAEPNINLGLDVTLNAPQQIFVRGHGLDAEVGGKIAIGGTASNPRVTGALSLRRGTFNLIGQILNFTSGTISFDRSSLARKVDPSLNFVAQTSAGGVSATLTVTGYADAPVITLTSVPQLPQDEILARLLFGQSVTQLSPFQIASVAQGVASLSGFGGGMGVLGDIRQGLGLDRLSVGSDTKGTGAAVEAGTYVARGVYVGAKQGISGGTQAQVQIDVTKHIKLQTTLGEGNGAPVTGITPQNDPGSSVGISYQFEY